MLAALVKILISAGLLLLVIGAKWAIGWALFGGFMALLLACALPIFRFFFPRDH